MKESWLLDELALGLEHDEGRISMTGGTSLSLGVSSDVMTSDGSWFPGGIVGSTGNESLRLRLLLPMMLPLLFDFRVESKPHHSRRIEHENSNLASSYGTGNITPFLKM